jgi:RNA polymerase sigma-70 factor (ECF subfamily)
MAFSKETATPTRRASEDDGGKNAGPRLRLGLVWLFGVRCRFFGTGHNVADGTKGQLMSDSHRFSEFVRRIRAGDPLAAEEVVREYEPLVRREIRMRLKDRRLRRVFDSMDICQSVLASFFVRASAGSYDLDEPKDLVRLLVKISKNKVASAARAQHRQRRDHRRAVSDGADQIDRVTAREPTPSQQVAGKELLKCVRERLTSEELELTELRGQGLSWGSIAEKLGGTPQARRMQLSRAVERVARELRLDDPNNV